MPLLVCLGQSGQVMAPRQRWRVMHLHPLLDLTLDDGKKKPLLGCSSMHKVLYPFFNSGEPPWRTFPIWLMNCGGVRWWHMFIKFNIPFTFWHICCRLQKHLVQLKVCDPNKSSIVRIHNLASTMACCGIKSFLFGSLKWYNFEWKMNWKQKQKRKAFRWLLYSRRL